MTVKLKGTLPITIIICYATTAPAETNEKDNFYKTLHNEMRKAKNSGFVTCIGDFNARIQTKLNEEESCIGQHTFNKTEINIGNKSEGVQSNKGKKQHQSEN